MKHAIRAAAMALVLAAGLAQGAEIVSVKKIWSEMPHSAFTDLVWFHGRFYCTFREASQHVGGTNGQIRVITSADGEEWTSAAVLTEEGMDLRDPKISVMPDGRLMLVIGGSKYEGKKLLNRRPRVAFSKDGAEWTTPVPVLKDGDWLWRVAWDDGHVYGTSYHDGKLTLYKSDDGLKYERVTDLAVPDYPNETTLRFLADHTMVALVRRDKGDMNGYIGSSKPPYTEWTWHEVPHRLGGPEFVVLPDGSMIAGGRAYGEKGKNTTILAGMTLTSYTPLLTLPSGGDCSYPGFVYREGMLYLSYYSSHEGGTSIYFAKVKLN